MKKISFEWEQRGNCHNKVYINLYKCEKDATALIKWQQPLQGERNPASHEEQTKG